jgi:NAD+ kinase
VHEAEDADFTIVLGGDGTVLGAARKGVHSPVIIINTGNLGFLSTCSESLTTSAYEAAIETIDRVLLGEFTVTTRHLLHVTLADESEYMALNDVVVQPMHMNKLVKLALYGIDNVDDEVLICEYRSSGLIISTPTGSTAFSLSASGPIIHPSCHSFCVTPICPQGLTQRPLVLPHTTRLHIEPDGHEDLCLSIDGQEEHEIINESVKVRYNNSQYDNSHSIQTVNPLHTYYATLQKKLGWGIRPTK